MKTALIYAFPGSHAVDFAEVGGKGLSLMQGSKAKLPVPPGFILTVKFFDPWMKHLHRTALWKSFLKADETELPKICAELKKDAGKLVFTEGQKKLVDAALKKFWRDEKHHVAGPTALFAVRSSSPEEDMEGSSFAGGYETVLGVPPGQLEAAVRKAFISCLDYRVFVYKKENGFEAHDPKIAVVVQRQIASETAGVAFSLNPVTNNFDEAVINANFGLGETVVSGVMTPDTYTVDEVTLKISGRLIGSKEKSLWLTPKGGTVEKPGQKRRKPSLKDVQILALARLTKKVENFYKMPMDIEWAFCGGKLFLLQARPITGYMPISPEMMTAPGKRKRLYFDVTATIQGMDDPVCVTSTSCFLAIVKNVGKIFFNRDLTKNIATSIAWVSGGRLYLNFSVFLRLLGKDKVAGFVSVFDQLSARTMRGVDEKMYAAQKRKSQLLPLNMLWKLPGIAERLIESNVMPEHLHKVIQKRLDRFMAQMRSLAAGDLGFSDLANTMIRHLILDVFLQTVPLFVKSHFIFNIMEKMVGKEGKSMIGKLQFSLPNNITTEMGLALARVAELLPPRLTLDKLEARLKKKNLPKPFMKAWKAFLAEYGHRGLTELDLAMPKYHEAPKYLLNLLISIRKSPRGEGPLEVFERHRLEREETFQYFYKRLRAQNPRKAAKFASLYRQVEIFGGYRELHKYHAAFVVDLLRRKILKEAQALCKAGRLDSVEQVFDLTLDDLDAARKNKRLDLRKLGKKNKVFIERLKKVPLLPSIFDSRGLILRPPPLPVKKGEVAGVPVSPGKVRGRVKVLHAPDEKELKKGEILVARSTDPGWTPLFVNAAAVVLEVGGVLQHGALVAREYGLPCIVGVEKATSQWKDGDLVEVDGSSGIIRMINQ